MAIGKSDYEKRRGLVTIAFFRLDDRRRKYLFRERADIITKLRAFLKLAEQAATPEEKEIWDRLVAVNTRSSAPHTNCALSFCKLYHDNRAEADVLFELAAEYLASIST